MQKLSYDDLRRYQRWLIKLCRKVRGLFIALDMSMGKTAIVLYALRAMYLVEVRHALIVGTVRVANDTWPTEIAKWKEISHLDYVLLTGNRDQRKAALDKPIPYISIINRENFLWLVKHWGDKWPYDMLVWDESTPLKQFVTRTKGKRDEDHVDEKTGKTKKGKVNWSLTWFGAVCQVRKYLDRIVLLTGTPAPNGLQDLGGQAFVIDGGKRLGPNKTQFLKRFFYPDRSGYAWEPKDNALDDITDALSDIMFSLRADDYIDLPPKRVIPIFFDLPADIMKEYRKFKRTLISETYDVEAVSEGVLTNKLLQFTNGTMYRNNEDGSHDEVFVHDCKIRVLNEVMAEIGAQNVLCTYSFKPDIKLIKKTYKKAVTMNKNFVNDWNDGKIKFGLVHPGQIGHGTNLQFGGHFQIWFGPTHNFELWDQFNRRLDRPGQKHPTVTVFVLLAKNTVDVECYESTHIEKRSTQDEIHRRVCAHIKDDR
jgi:hypothetical protein